MTGMYMQGLYVQGTVAVSGLSGSAGLWIFLFREMALCKWWGRLILYLPEAGNIIDHAGEEDRLSFSFDLLK
jgi:hypothetical protein